MKSLATNIREWFQKSKARAAARAKTEAACAKAESQFSKDHPDMIFFTAIVHSESAERYTIIVRYSDGQAIYDPPPLKVYYVSIDLSSAQETQDRIELPKFRG